VGGPGLKCGSDQPQSRRDVGGESSSKLQSCFDNLRIYTSRIASNIYDSNTNFVTSSTTYSLDMHFLSCQKLQFSM
jgi:hypothetical protein